LAGYDNCPNSNTFRNQGGTNATNEWVEIYLQNATTRFNKLISGLEFSVQDVYAMQTMCPYEFVSPTLNPNASQKGKFPMLIRNQAAYAYSPFCQLFTYEEWEGFEYSIDLYFSGGSAYRKLSLNPDSTTIFVTIFIRYLS
jgi:hypothetical protein